MLIKELKNLNILLIASTMFVISGCRKLSSTEISVYANDFENGSLANISNGSIEVYNGTHVLGRYNTSYFKLSLNNLPKHSLAKISFDLYIHDSWDGNASYSNNLVGPDIWTMSIDSLVYLNTTFANQLGPPGSLYPPQSFPNSYMANNFPRTGAYDPSLPGACSLKNLSNGTSLYKIEKIIDHTSSTFVLFCADQLKQADSSDPKCDESWSVDNIKISVIQ